MKCPICASGHTAKQTVTRTVLDGVNRQVKLLSLTAKQWWRIDMRSFYSVLRKDVEQLKFLGTSKAIEEKLHMLNQIESIVDWYIKNAEQEPND